MPALRGESPEVPADQRALSALPVVERWAQQFLGPERDQYYIRFAGRDGKNLLFEIVDQVAIDRIRATPPGVPILIHGGRSFYIRYDTRRKKVVE